MSRASIRFSQPRPCSGGETLRRCRNRRGTDNVVLIDVDSDSFNNVVIIDVPESLQNKFRGSSVRRNNGKGPWATVICLDDDEGTDGNNAYAGVTADKNVNNGASSSKRGYSMSFNFASSSNSGADNCQFVRENLSPVKLSKGKRTYSGKGSTNRYGLCADTESGSSDSDYLDCELMEGPFGRLWEQWEKASLKRKCDTRNCQAGVKDPEMVFSGTQRNVNVANEYGEPKATAFVDKESKEKEAPAHSIPKGDGDLGCSYYKPKKAVVDNDDHLQSILETQFLDGKADPPCWRDPLTEELPFDNAEHHSGQYFEKGGTSFYNEEEHVPHRPDSFPDREWVTRQVNHVENVFQNTEQASVAEPDLSRAVPCVQKNFYNGKANLVEKESSNCQAGTKNPEMVVSGAHRNVNVANEHGQPKETAFVDKESKEKEAPAHSILKGDYNLGCSYYKSKKAVVDNDDLLQSILETRFPDDKADPPCRSDPLTEELPFNNAEHHSGQCFEKGGSSFYNEEEHVPHRPDSFPGREWGTRQVNHVENVFQNKEKASVVEPDLSRAVSCGQKNLYNGKANLVEKESSMSQCQHPVNHEVGHGKPISGNTGKISQETITENSTTNTNGHHVNKVQPVQSHSCSVSANEEPVKLVSNSRMEDKRDDLVHGLDGDVMLNSDGCILSGREALKETDEYKKALEEEWASRQRALQIQAEEAKNLKQLLKRRKAEIMRLLDMERRQKQRVEEIRETQKKDEENMNLKEVIRAAVRKELNQLELTCHDMASLLRGLGILVGVVGQHPSSNEVRLAYKRALLTFHPDRASRSDIRQQVEAEEKFKLISRMREELLPT